MSRITLEDAKTKADALRAAVGSVVRGRDDDITFLVTALLANGHILLEDFPGSGKTLMAVRLAEAIRDDVVEAEYDIKPFRRVQCTPDLFPSDITGIERLNKETGQTVFEYGPIFAYVLLLDEINRAPAKVQSACLEAMAERRVTIGNTDHKLSDLFFVIGTQNPLDQRGTYELPAAQLDRFLFKRILEPIEEKYEREILRTGGVEDDKSDWEPVVAKSEIIAMRAVILETIPTDAEIIELLLGIAAAIQRRVDGCQNKKDAVPSERERLKRGSRPSIRSLKKLMSALKVHAFMRGSDKVETRDVKVLAGDFFRHRIFPMLPMNNDEIDELIGRIVLEAVERRQKATLAR